MHGSYGWPSLSLALIGGEIDQDGRWRYAGLPRDLARDEDKRMTSRAQAKGAGVPFGHAGAQAKGGGLGKRGDAISSGAIGADQCRRKSEDGLRTLGSSQITLAVKRRTGGSPRNKMLTSPSYADAKLSVITIACEQPLKTGDGPRQQKLERAQIR